jgi:hypothetical protein
MSRRRTFGFGLLLVAMLTVGAASGAAAYQPAPQTAMVTVVHGLRGIVADVYLDGTLVLPAFEPERTTDPLPIPAGSHVVEIRGVNDDPSSEPLVSETVDVPPAGDFSAVAHLDSAGEPTLTVYPEVASSLAPGTSRVVIRHAAAAPAIDVNLDGASVAAGLVNPGEAAAPSTPGAHQLEVRTASQPTLLAAPQQVPLDEGTATNLYLVGRASDSSLVWLAQRITGMQSAPVAVQSGTDGLAAPAGFPLPAVLLLIGVAALSATRLVVGRRAMVEVRRSR